MEEETMLARQQLEQGKLDVALQTLEQDVRAHPADPALRIFLFQLLCVIGDWQCALHQLRLTGELNPDNSLMVQTYGNAIACECLRQQVFAGVQSPLVLGEPPPWIAHLIEALRLIAQGEPERAKQLQNEAFEQVSVNPGRLNDEPFNWLADADQRIGPVLEAIINGRYYWVPMQHLRSVELDPPADLRDMVWTPARIRFVNGTGTVALIPSRYCCTEASNDSALMLARKTIWQQPFEALYIGLGQRMLVTDSGEYALLNTRNIHFETD
jgi:type VI secretion system protein ImpE